MRYSRKSDREISRMLEELNDAIQKYKDREAAVARMWHDPASQ